MSDKGVSPAGTSFGTSDGRASSVLLRPGMDRILDILRKRHRRLILLLLKEGAAETETDVILRGTSDVDEAEIELVHNHLPKLEEAGYIEWDRETGEISKGPRFEEIEPIIELLEDHGDELPPGWP